MAMETGVSMQCPACYGPDAPHPDPETCMSFLRQECASLRATNGVLRETIKGQQDAIYRARKALEWT